MLNTQKLILILSFLTYSVAYSMDQHRSQRFIDGSHMQLCRSVLEENVQTVMDISHTLIQYKQTIQLPNLGGPISQEIELLKPLTPTAQEMVHLIRATKTDNQRMLCGYLALCAASSDPNYYDDMAREHRRTKKPLSTKEKLNPFSTDHVLSIIQNGREEIAERQAEFSLPVLRQKFEDALKDKIIKTRKEKKLPKDKEILEIIQKIQNAVQGIPEPQEPEPTTSWGHFVKFGKDNGYVLAALGSMVGLATYGYNFVGFKKAQQLMENEESWMNWTS